MHVVKMTVSDITILSMFHVLYTGTLLVDTRHMDLPLYLYIAKLEVS